MRVLLLSRDRDLWRLGLSAALEHECSVSQVDDLDLRNTGDADIVVIAGVAAAETWLSRLSPNTCVIVVMEDPASASERIGLLAHGADVVLHGDVPDDEIVAQVRAIARRGDAPVRRVARTGRRKAKIMLDKDRRQAVVLGRPVSLTLLEGNLLATFLARPGEVLDAQTLMTSVWGSPFGARSTVSAYIRRLRIKIEPDSCNPVFIRTVWGGGYLYRPDGR
jgi:DNA-binding response OmpR family regulator